MHFRILLLSILSVGLLSFYALPVAAQATITVTSTADNLTTDGACTLREALDNADDNAATRPDCAAGTGTDTIEFNIAGAGPHTIAITSVLPIINAPVIIDGLTQAGANCQTRLMIVLSGADSGLRINASASGSTVRGLVLQGAPTGVAITLLPSNNNIIQCNYIGTDATGTSANGNFTGIFLANGSENNLIGGTNNANEGNLISGNLSTGIVLTGGATTNNHIAGNKIGTDLSGTADLGNINDGIQLASGANNNIIGIKDDNTSDALEGNLISGNDRFGILINTSTVNNRIAGNRIGTNLSGTGAIANGNVGISIQNSSNGNIIGTNSNGVSDALEGNIISGNGSSGIAVLFSSSNTVIAGNLIGTDVTGRVDLGNFRHGVDLDNASANIIGTNGNGSQDTLERNIISGNDFTGVTIGGAGANSNRVAGNYIGTDIVAGSAIGNGTFGVEIHTNAASNIIGTDGSNDGFNANERNVISGNLSIGVFVSTTGTNNRIAGNTIGTNSAGNAAIPNGGVGVSLQGGANNNIIGTNGDGFGDAEELNLISGHSTTGILLADADNNSIAGNRIGTNANGDAAIPNGVGGILLQNVSTGNFIGTNSDGSAGEANEGNLISGNTNTGISIATDSPNNIITSNIIGLNMNITAAVPNGVGIFVGSSNNRIGTNGDGTSDAIESNVISGNTSDGIQVMLATAQNNSIAGNIIGLDFFATTIFANGQNGINIDSAASNNIIGGALDVQSNIIGGNGAAGIRIDGANTTNNTINNNYIGTNTTQANLANGTAGISNSSSGTGSSIITNNWIFYNPVGILLNNSADLGAAGQSEQNCLYQNTAGLSNTTGVNTFFENNWWGAASGPSGAGTGSGDSVSANVDYLAFLTVPPIGCAGIVGVFIDPLAVSAAEGGTVSYTVMLESAPAIGETVTITLTIDAAAMPEINGVNPPTLTFNFTSANWNIPQQFDITLNDDILANGSRTYTAAFTHSSDSSDPASGYDAAAALVIDSVDLMVVDNETPNVVINPTAFGVRTGDSRTYDVSLTVEPTTNVTITLTQLDANCTISPNSLTFTDSLGANPWNVPQQITVTAVGAVGDICTIEHTPSGGTYTGVGASDVVATIRRDLVVVPPTSGTGSEPEIAVFDPAISKLGLLFPGQTGIVGEELEWVVTVSNVGTVVGTNVTVTDTLIPALQIDSVDAPGATVTISGQTVTVVYPNLAVGQTVNFSIFTTVLSGVSIDNTACVMASNQAAQECAVALPISQLPSTGESPIWRYGLLAGIGILLAAVLIVTKKGKRAKA